MVQQLDQQQQVQDDGEGLARAYLRYNRYKMLGSNRMGFSLSLLEWFSRGLCNAGRSCSIEGFIGKKLLVRMWLK